MSKTTQKTSNPQPSSVAAENRMKAAKQKGTKPELDLQTALSAYQLAFTTNTIVDLKARRQADFVFTEAKVAVFVDGCFWHGCPLHGTWPKQNADFWRTKIETNQQRDLDTNSRLIKEGWCVLRIWEHEDMQQAATYIASIVRVRLLEQNISEA